MKSGFTKGVFIFALIYFITVLGPVTAEAKQSIPNDPLFYNGHYYYYYPGVITWNEAEEECEKLGGHLVTFSNSKEEEAVWEYIKAKKTPAWIGMYNAGFFDKIYRTVENDLVWVTGEKVKYTNFKKDEPDYGYHVVQDSYDKYMVIGKTSDVQVTAQEDTSVSWGDFDDAYCIQKEAVKGYICEWDIYTIKVEKKTVTLKKGKTYTIKYTVYDEAGDKQVKDAKVSFKSSKKKIATVSKKGKVTAVKSGSCYITLTYKGCTYKVKVKVQK